MCLTGALIGGITSAMGASKAASAQKSAANQQYELGMEQLDFSKEMYDDQRTMSRNMADRQRGNIYDTFRDQRELLQDHRDSGFDLARQTYGDARGIVGDTFRDRRANINDTYRDQMGFAHDARNRAVDLAKRTARKQSGYYNPYYERGNAAGEALAWELGTGERPEDYRGFEETEGYKFRRQQGQDAIDASAAAKGGLFSGATLKDSMEFATGLADQSYNKHLDRLTGQDRQGMQAANALANISGQRRDAITGARNLFSGRALTASGARSSALDAALRGRESGRLAALGNFDRAKSGVSDQYMQNLYNSIGSRGRNLANTWASVAQMGQTAGNNYTNAAGNAYNYMGNALANYGDASAAGAVGMSNAINGGLNNYMNWYGQQQGMGTNPAPIPTTSGFTTTIPTTSTSYGGWPSGYTM